MHHRVRLSLLCAIAGIPALLTGCLATAPKIAPAERQTLGPVAVTSQLGRELQLRSIGLTVFQNKSGPQDVVDWQVDALLEATAVEAMTASGLSGAKALALNDAAVKGGNEAALAAASKAGFRTLVTITYLNAENQPFLNPGSYGIYSRGSNTCLYSKFFVTVWNVNEQTRRKGSPQIECQRVDGLVWKSTLDEYTTQERASIRQALTSQITKQLRNALGDTGLADATP